MPNVSGLEQFIKGLYDDGSAYYHEEPFEDATGIEKNSRNYDELESRIHDVFPVFDPRYLGYEFPSYTFIETENHLAEASEESTTISLLSEKAQLLGTVLGDVDLIHRRIDENRWTNAEFAKWAKQRLEVFEQFETYPIFEIDRWYGKDINEPLHNSFNGNMGPVDGDPIRSLTDDEEAVIEALFEDPGLLKLTSDYTRLDITIPNSIADLDQSGIEEIISRLKAEDILLGSSITYEINRTPWQCAFMGLSLGAENGEVDHDGVIEALQDPDFDEDEEEYWDEFIMPFITSGVGQGWADILIELRIQDLSDLDDIAQKIRDIEDVESTKTYLMTDTLLNEYTRR